MLNTDATGNLGMDRHQYSSTFEKERSDLNAMQYSSRNRPRDRPDIGNLDPSTRAQYKIDADLSASSRNSGVNSYRSDVHNLKPTHDRFTESRATSKLSDSRESTQASSLQNAYTRRAVNFPDSSRDSVTVNSGMDKQYSPTTNYGNTQMNHSRMNDNLYSNRQKPNASYTSPQDKYPSPNPTQYSHGERYPHSLEVGTARNRDGATSKKYSSPAEDDLRKPSYDKKYQLDGQAAIQKRQAQALGDTQSRLSQREKDDSERASDQRLDSARGRYDAGRIDRTESANRRLRDDDNTRLTSAAAAPSSKLDQRRNIVKNTDPPNARKFTKSENGKERGIERGRWYADLNEKPTPRHMTNLNDDYYRDEQRDRETVSGKRPQNTTTVSATSAARERVQQQNERQFAVDSRRLETGLTGSSRGKAEDNWQTSKQQPQMSSSLLKMKEDLRRDQMKLDRQLRTNAVVNEEPIQRSDRNLRFDKGRSPDLDDTDYGRSVYRSSYATGSLMVRFK